MVQMFGNKEIRVFVSLNSKHDM